MQEAVGFTGVSKYFGSVPAVDELTLSVSTGETVALLGPNGAGKSTAIGMLLDLLRPDSGAVRIFGSEPKAAVSAGEVGSMLQDGGLMPGVTVGELVGFARRRFPNPAPHAEVLELAGLEDLAGRRVDRLSGGQTQRLRFALAVAGAPPLLILDEPTASLDVEARRSFWGSMRDYAASGRTLLFATHYLEEADANADRVVVLAGGQVVADGPAAEIKHAAGGRTVRFNLGGQPADGLSRLPGVTAVHTESESAVLYTDDADATVPALYAHGFQVRDLEVRTVELEEVFLALTRTHGSSRGREPRHAAPVG